MPLNQTALPPEHRDQIQSLAATKQYSALASHYEQLQKRFQFEQEDFLQWSNAEKSLGRLDTALHVLSLAVTNHGESVDLLIAKGKIHRDRGEPTLALRAYQQALAIDPNAHNAHCQAGIVYELQQQWPQAAACYRAAIQLKPDNGMHWLGLAKCLQANGDTTAGAEAFANAERFMADESDYNKACLYSLMGNHNLALQHLHRFCQQHQYAAEWAKQDPDLRAIREDSRFAKACVGALE